MDSLHGALQSVLQISSVDYKSLIPSLLEALENRVQGMTADLSLEQSLSDICCRLEALQQIFLSYSVTAQQDCSVLQGQKNQAHDSKLEENILQCVKNVIFPLLQKLHLCHNHKDDKAVSLLTPTCDLLATCLKLADPPTKFMISNFCLDSLSYHSSWQESSVDSTAVENTASVKSEVVVDLHSLMEILRCVLQEHNNLKVSERGSVPPVDLPVIFPDDTWTEKIFLEIIKMIANKSDTVVTEIVSLVLVKLLRCDAEKQPHRLEMLWRIVCEVFHKSVALPSSGVGGSSSVSEKPYIILCGLADFYFPVGQICVSLREHIQLVHNTDFWIMIQSGLVQKNPVTRKRSLYLLKRIIDICESESATIIPMANRSDKERVCATGISSGSCAIFRWHPKLKTQLSKIWENFVLLIETLNEKQLHVVRPLFPRLNHLIDACSKPACLDKSVTQPECLGLPLLHSSWVVTVIRRALIHESVYVIMWGVKALLRTDPQTFPLLQQGQDSFISGEFLIALKETRLYCREPKEPVGSQPEIGHLTRDFLLKCWKSLESTKRAEFFRAILLKIRGDTWGQFPLLYLWQGLASLPISSLWNKQSVLAIREIMSTSLTTVEQFNRGAIQCFLVESLVNLIDLELVTPADLAVVLAACPSEESLRRGTTLWKKVAWRLNQISLDNKNPENWTKTGLENWIQTSIVQYLKAEEKSAPGYQVQLSRIVLLLADGVHESEVTDQNAALLFLNTCLSPVADILSRLINHAYLPIEKGDRAVGLLMSLLDEVVAGPVHVASVGLEDPVIKLLLVTTAQFLEEIVHQIMRGKDQVTCTEYLPSLHSYLYVLKILGHPVCVDHIGERPLIQALSGMVKWSITVTDKLTANDSAQSELTEQDQITGLVAMALLGKATEIFSVIRDSSVTLSSDWLHVPVIQEIHQFVARLKIQQGLSKPVRRDNPERLPKERSISQKAWGRIVALYLGSQWQCVEFCLALGAGRPKSLHSLDTCFEALVLGSGDSSLPVIRCLHKLLPECLEENQEETVIQTIERVWSRLREDWRNVIFWQELPAFIAMAFQPALVTSSEHTAVLKTLIEYAKELLIQGEERRGVANVLVTQLCEVFSGDKTLAVAAHFCDVVAEACVFGSLPQRIDKTWFETCAYIDSLGEKCTVNKLFPYLGNPDVMVRVTVISFLTQLQPTSAEHCHFVSLLIRALIRKHDDVNKTKAAWNFVNSLQHRLRLRLSQALLVLEPFIQTKELTEVVWVYIWSVLAQETQPSVRNLLEWLALRLLVRHHHLHPTLWGLFDNTPVTEQRHLSVCSLLFVVAHLGCHLPSQLRESYYSKAIVVVFPWCTVHHFNTRIHAQVCLKKLWHQCQEFDLRPLTDRFPMIQACLNFSKDESNSTKNAEKLEAHYIFSTFDLQGDYNIETIFKTFPRLACLSDEEWISPSSFLRLDATWREQTSHYLPLFNSNNRLKSFTPGPWRLKGEDSYETYTEIDGQDGDVQKKILPWRFMKPDAEAEEQLELRRMKKRGDGLILVTSLIEKIPNLGGLCRTSEIFGVSEFVIGNLQSVNDRAFQSLSVTAHKWLPVTEVKLFQLKDYLLSKRRQGFTLVGVEQTANSVSLTDYQFPQKTLLLLGNEKEGIPANLIQFLDTCVEIPQQGVIRSLNVHVSGALFVWEYTRQQLTKSASQT